MLGFEFSPVMFVNTIIGAILGAAFTVLVAWLAGRRTLNNQLQMARLLASLYEHVTGHERRVYVDEDNRLRFAVTLKPDNIAHGQTLDSPDIDEEDSPG